ncbi:endonuclease [Bacillus sp. MCCB 382]|uniref:LAGLIDADG family homing endonuclease n=1 Tax=Bacillus sp. MCCB 382 TaxID=2860197 RepID=UPI001C586061|nr:endonuclease [Bacillus sp. MCCB 382]
MTRKKKCTLEITEIIQMYEEGEKTVDIARRANVSTRYINSVLQQNKVERTPHGSWKRKYRVNEDYFKTWSNNMAYLLGFFAADGYISSRNHTFCFSQKDPDILEQIREELQSNHPLVMNNTGVYTLIIGSKVMKYDLMNLHGMTSDKSNALQMPEIPEKYLSHFVRGYFDGDGNVTYEGYTVTFVGNSLAFLLSMKSVFDLRGFKTKLKLVRNHYRLFIVSRLSLKMFADWIYREKEMYLERKYLEFEKESLEATELIDKISTAKTISEKKKNFLELYSHCIDENKACKGIGIDLITLDIWLRNDLEFEDRFNQVKKVVRDFT